jgi:D-beta-D-heptose 7-phosphate kinase/D-beta-D-heptose 1-phosphate adenosyltransferase
MINLNNKKIAVVGDFIIDEYYQVSVNKISPEFPIPVLQTANLSPKKTLPGGAGSVCNQFINFKNKIYYFGLINRDSLNIINRYNFIDTVYSVVSSSIKSPTKKRFYQDFFPICRIDVESKNYDLCDFDLNNFQDKICENLSKCFFDLIIFSDYNKGIFNNYEVSNYFYNLSKNTIKIVDPKNGPAKKWLGCDIIKPNYKEACEITGKTNFKDQAKYLQDETNAYCVIITKESEGIKVLYNNDYFEYVPQTKVRPESVIGAGDCFISMLSVCILNNINIFDSIKICSDHCSKYVSDKDNKPIHPIDFYKTKFITDLDCIKNRNFRLSFTNGCFDILHPGHIDLLKFAKSKADKLLVAINSNESVARQNKSHKLVNDINIRKKMLESFDFVDYIVEFHEDTPLEIIKTINPDVLVKGSDYPEPVGSSFSGEVCLFPIKNDYSTTKIIEKIKNL